MFPLFLPFGETAGAYGGANHERVIDAGKGHFVVLKGDGSVWSWGDGTYGQLGVRLSENESHNPSAIRKTDGNRLSDIKSIAAGGYHTVALDKEGHIWTWGRNSNGQLGYVTSVMGTSDQMAPNDNPREVMMNENDKLKAIAISAGENHTLAVGEDGRVWAWGSGANGQIGQMGMSATPEIVAGLSNIVAVAAGADHSLALTATGDVFAWGRGTSGQLGTGKSAHNNPQPEKIESLTGIMEIAAGDNHTIALKQDRTTVWAWGSNQYGQLGDGGRQERLNPVQVQDIRGVKMIAAGNDHTIAIKEDGTVWTWGRNTSGTQEIRSTPIQIKGVNNAFAIGGGGGEKHSHTLAIHEEGTVWMWDELSSDSTTQLPIFKQVPGIDEVKKVMEYPFVQGGQVFFKYNGTSVITDVKLSGSFNNMVDIPLIQNGNEWTIQLDLMPGTYEYGFKVNGKWEADPLNRHKDTNNFGDIVSLLTVDQYPSEGPIINDKEVTFTYNSFDYNGQLEFDAETSYVALRASFNSWVEIPLKKQRNNIWTLTRTLSPGDYTYEFIVRDRLTGAVAQPRLDPLNPNKETNATTGSTRNTFKVEEQIITKVPVEKVEIDRGTLMDMVVDEQATLEAIVSPSNATNKNVTWTSSNPSIVTVDKGKLTAYAAGTAVIFVAAANDSSKSAMITVTVKPSGNAISYPRVGYEEKGSHTGVDPNKVWHINFSSELAIGSVSTDNVYVLTETGEKVPVGWKLSNGDRTLDVSLQGTDTYKPGATYYLFIENTIKPKYGQGTLKDKYQMKFQIKL